MFRQRINPRTTNCEITFAAAFFILSLGGLEQVLHSLALMLGLVLFCALSLENIMWL